MLACDGRNGGRCYRVSGRGSYPCCQAMGADEEPGHLPRTTRWHRRHGRSSYQERWAKQQYLTPPEEKTLVEYILQMARNGNPLPVQSLRHIAMIIACQRNTFFKFQGLTVLRLPGKNWSQGLWRRHKELKAKQTKAIDWNRYDHNIYDNVAA